jgi:glycine/D-amino acid oxidase-like deaminating enzyme
MSSASAIQRIAIVGTGVIGASWAAYYLARIEEEEPPRRG